MKWLTPIKTNLKQVFSFFVWTQKYSPASGQNQKIMIKWIFVIDDIFGKAWKMKIRSFEPS